MLKTDEEEHLRITSAIYEEVKKGKVPADACHSSLLQGDPVIIVPYLT